jgi:hypothetical protein
MKVVRLTFVTTFSPKRCKLPKKMLSNFQAFVFKGNQKLKITPLQFKRKCLHLMYRDDK